MNRLNRRQGLALAATPEAGRVQGDQAQRPAQEGRCTTRSCPSACRARQPARSRCWSSSGTAARTAMPSKPVLDAWVKQLPPTIVFRRVPCDLRRAHAQPPAALLHAGSHGRRGPDACMAIFAAIHTEQGNMLDTPEAMVKLLQPQGLDAGQVHGQQPGRPSRQSAFKRPQRIYRGEQGDRGLWRGRGVLHRSVSAGLFLTRAEHRHFRAAEAHLRGRPAAAARCSGTEMLIQAMLCLHRLYEDHAATGPLSFWP